MSLLSHQPHSCHNLITPHLPRTYPDPARQHCPPLREVKGNKVQRDNKHVTGRLGARVGCFDNQHGAPYLPKADGQETGMFGYFEPGGTAKQLRKQKGRSCAPVSSGRKAGTRDMDGTSELLCVRGGRVLGEEHGLCRRLLRVAGQVERRLLPQRHLRSCSARDFRTRAHNLR